MLQTLNSHLDEREVTLEVLRTRAGLAITGQGSLVMVRGEAYVGKTALVRHLADAQDFELRDAAFEEGIELIFGEMASATPTELE